MKTKYTCTNILDKRKWKRSSRYNNETRRQSNMEEVNTNDMKRTFQKKYAFQLNNESGVKYRYIDPTGIMFAPQEKMNIWDSKAKYSPGQT